MTMLDARAKPLEKEAGLRFMLFSLDQGLRWNVVCRTALPDDSHGWRKCTFYSSKNAFADLSEAGV